MKHARMRGGAYIGHSCSEPLQDILNACIGQVSNCVNGRGHCVCVHVGLRVDTAIFNSTEGGI